MREVIIVLAALALLLILLVFIGDELETEWSSSFPVSTENITKLSFLVSYLGADCPCINASDISIMHEQFDFNPELPYSCPKDLKEKKYKVDFNTEKFCRGMKEDDLKYGFDNAVHNSEPATTDPYYHYLRTGNLSRKCPRYIIAQTTGSGLGHRHGTVVFAANLAIEFGFTLVLSDSLRDSLSSHGRYPHFRESLGLNHISYASELDRTNLDYFVVDGRESFWREYLSTFRHRCNLLVSAEVGNHTSCRSAFLRFPKFCFDMWPGAYERARRHLQGSYPALDPASLPHFAAAERRRALAVVWHVRCGDIVVDRGPEYFARVHALIAASGADHQDYVFWQGCNASFPFLLQLLPSAIVVDSDADTALLHMRAADVLVHSGSSFTSSAALAAPGPQLYFQSPPKEARWGGASQATYALRAAVNVNADGLLEPYQSFAMESGIAAAAAAAAAEPAAAGDLNWTEIYAPHVTRLLRALHLRKQLARPPPPAAGTGRAASADPGSGPGLSESLAALPAGAGPALRALGRFLEDRVISGALAGAAAGDVDVWVHNAALARRLLPGWRLVLSYDSDGAPPRSLCRLRELANVQLHEMSGARLPPRRWPLLALFSGPAHAVALVGHPARALTPCDAEALTAWAAGCDGDGGGGGGVLRLGGGCRVLTECAWAVGRAALPAVREAVAGSMRPGPGRTATEGEASLLRRLGGGGGGGGT
jgi:hypothetical protein